ARAARCGGARACAAAARCGACALIQNVGAARARELFAVDARGFTAAEELVGAVVRHVACARAPRPSAPPGPTVGSAFTRARMATRLARLTFDSGPSLVLRSSALPRTARIGVRGEPITVMVLQRSRMD